MELKDLYQVFANSPHNGWIVDPEDAKRIDKVVRTAEAKNVLELGTGIGASTAFLANATSGRVTTIEQYEKCIKIAKELIPKDLQERIDFIYCTPELQEFPGIPHQKLSVYHALTENLVLFGKKDFDLVMVDGSGPFMDKDELMRFPNGDVFYILNLIKPGGVVYVDGRLDFMRIARRHFARYLNIINCENKFSLMQRTDIPFDGTLKDDILQNLIETGYFK